MAGAEQAVSDAKDPLTGLTDRRTFLKKLRREALRTTSSGGLMALLLVNVDQFRRVNSVFGLRMGDQVLIRMAELLQDIARRSDLVARVGDDEFALLLPGVMNEGHAVLAANKIRRSLELPLEVDGERIPLMATIGIALCPNHSSHPESLFKHAEMALLKARGAELGYLVAEPVDNLEIADTWDLEIELESAVENEELELWYQPQVSLADGRVVGAEALMRWNSPSRGLLRPGVFIPVAERTGRIRALTQWALNTALRQAAECREKTGQEIQVAVNMPANAFQNPELNEMVGSAMKLWSAPKGSLTLEITESLAMADPASAFAVLKDLRQTGARIAIDDFGTGYSSLAYFRNIPADELKIDKTFVESQNESDKDQALIGVMVEIGHRFSLEVVAEGVEQESELKAVKALGCDIVQGNLIAEPLPFEEFCDWLAKAGRDWRAAPGARPLPRESDESPIQGGGS
jgi:diguanylate cyclase (GGDEF)-like protein